MKIDVSRIWPAVDKGVGLLSSFLLLSAGVTSALTLALYRFGLAPQESGRLYLVRRACDS